MLRTKRIVLVMTAVLLLLSGGASYAGSQDDKPVARPETKSEPEVNKDLILGFGSGTGFGSGGDFGSASGVGGFGGSASNGGSVGMSYGFGSGFTTGMPGSTGSDPFSNPTNPIGRI